MRATAARVAADDARRKVEETLVQTAAVDVDPAAPGLAARLTTLEAAVAQARADIQQAQQIPVQRQLVHDIAAGRARPDRGFFMKYADPLVAEKHFLDEARQRLASLTAINVAGCQATIERAETEAAEIRSQVDEFAEVRRQRCFRPECMSWNISSL